MSWREICWNIVNSLLAGALVFLGGIVATDGTVDTALLLASSITALIAAISKFATYWSKEEEEYCDQNNKLLAIIPFI